jgi:hypothetical protein
MRGLATIVLLIAVCSPAGSQPMTFRHASRGGNCDECSWVAAHGDITSDTPALFRRFMQESVASGYGHVNRVYLDSQGGDLIGGIELGKLFRANHVTVAVFRTVKSNDSDIDFEEEGGKCVSACSYAFIGGERRNADSNQIGIHQFSASLTNSGRPLVVFKNEGGQQIAAALSTVQD